MKKKLAIIGTQGLPNKYGGFETLADHLSRYLIHDFEVIVFCSSVVYDKKITNFNGVKLRYLPLSANGFSSILYDSISLLLSLKYDKILILGASSGYLLPLLFPWKNKLVLNCGGVDWRRSKWSSLTKIIIKSLERLSVRNVGVVVADNQGMREYFCREYAIDSILIEYGGDQVEYIDATKDDFGKYPFLKGKYAFSVARIQEDNNVQLILESFELFPKLPLVFVGNWNNSSFGKRLKMRFGSIENLYLIDAIFDHRELNLLRSNCYIYVHGHSAGGTNPALVEAMNLRLPVLAYASGFNEYTTENKAIYFSSTESLLGVLQSINEEILHEVKSNMYEIANTRYKWRRIAAEYLKTLNNYND